MCAVYPDLSPTEMTVPVSVINRYIGTDLPGQQLADSLAKMALSGRLSDDGSLVYVSVPPTRCDVLHACDVIEVCASVPPGACPNLTLTHLTTTCVIAAIVKVQTMTEFLLMNRTLQLRWGTTTFRMPCPIASQLARSCQ